jgi:cardiolipin synthase
MSSTRALDNLNARRRRWSAFPPYAKDRLNNAIENARARRALSVSIVRFSASSQFAALLPLSVLYLPAHPASFLEALVYGAVWCTVLTLALVLCVGLLRDENKRPKRMLGMANRLTIVRFVLVIPLALLVLDRRFIAALVVYVICLATDVLDGVVARSRRQQTEFGTIMDPLADIVSTAAVYGAFLGQGLIPAWVFAILMARYVSLFAGMAVLFLTVGPLELRATPVGKIVGVLQGIAGIMILALAGSGLQWQGSIGVTLFPCLGIIFGSVIISQLVIAVRFVKDGAVSAGSRG